MRFATVVSGVCFTAVAFAIGADAAPRTSLAEVLRAVLSASGAPYRAHVASTSRERVDGIDYDLTSESEGSRFVIRRCADGICDGLAIDGDRTSVVNINGTALPLPIDVDPLQSTLRAVATGAFAGPEFAAAGGRVEESGDGTLDGASVHRLVVSTAHGEPLDVAIDAKTSLVSTVSSQRGKVTFAFKDYRRTDGMMLPFEVDVDGKRNQIFRRRSRVAGALGTPAGLVPRIGVPAEIPFSSGKLPVVACTVGTVATHCLFDTGNSGLVMSADLAAKLGLRPRVVRTLRAFGRAVAGVVRAPAVRLGSATYPGATYVVVSDMRGSGADVALGADVFAHASITLDYPGRRVTIAPEAALANALTMTFENFVPITGAGIGDQVLPVEIDTGDDGGVTIPRALLDAHATLFAGTRTAANGDRSGTAGPVRLGSYLVDRAPATATTLLSGPARGHLGSAVLDRFRLRFDYAHERFAADPRTGDTSVTKAP